MVDRFEVDARTTLRNEIQAKKRTKITKRELSCPRTKQKCSKIYVDQHKQVRSSRQNDKLVQWVMNRAVLKS